MSTQEPLTHPERLQPCHQAQAESGVSAEQAPRVVLFACVHNAGRSQMATAWLNHFADPRKVRAISAGTQPGERVHPVVVEAMREVGIDLASVQPQLLTPELAAQAHLLITMGCGDACPVVPGLRRDDWPLLDPTGQPIERVREIRDDILERVTRLVAQAE